MDLPFEVVDLGPADHPAPGETAPDFKRPLVTEEYWEDVALSQLTAESPVLLVFFPMDGSFPATYIWREIAERGWGNDDDLTVVGLSISTPYEHEAFIADAELPHRLFSDPGNGVAETYGIAHDLDGMAGVSEARPAAFLLDVDRTVEYAWAASEWPAFPDYDAIAAAIADL